MRTASFAILILAVLTACGPTTPNPSPSVCRVDAPSTAPPSYDVELGTRISGMYVPWIDGEQVGVVTGGQGAAMVVPRIRIPDAPADAAERCMRLELDNEFDDGMSMFPSLELDETFRVIDGGWETVSIEVPLDYPDLVDMRMITFTATVRSETFTAEGMVSVELLGGT